MWRVCALAVVLCAWEVCGAQQLSNLVQPQLTKLAPPADGVHTHWKIFDHDTSTYDTVWNRGGGLIIDFARHSLIRPIKYRLILAAHVRPGEYPLSWEVLTDQINEKVTDAVFSNGVYEGALPGGKITRFQLSRFNERKVDIAEIELLGTREALDELWPYGNYPCSQRTAVITNVHGPKSIFVKSKLITGRGGEDLRNVFSATSESVYEYEFDGTKSLFVVAYLPKTPMVQEVVLAVNLSPGGKAVLQGNRCAPHCHKYGSKGWERLGAGKPYTIYLGHGGFTRLRIFVENPGEYKAYRIKFPNKDGKQSSVWLRGVYFLGCTA